MLFFLMERQFFIFFLDFISLSLEEVCSQFTSKSLWWQTSKNYCKWVFSKLAFFSPLLFLICHVGQCRLEKMGLCIATAKAVSGGMLLWKAIMGCLMDKWNMKSSIRIMFLHSLTTYSMFQITLLRERPTQTCFMLVRHLYLLSLFISFSL